MSRMLGNRITLIGYVRQNATKAAAIKWPYRLVCAIVVAGATFCSGQLAEAGSATWNAQAGNWNVNTNWLPNTTHPQAADEIASLTNNITGNRIVTLNAAKTIGTLNIGDSNFSHSFTLSGTNTLTFDVSAGTAAINKAVGSGVIDTISVPILLSDNLIVTSDSTSSNGRIVLSSSISGVGQSLTKEGVGRLELTGQSTFTGRVQ
ncbi:MAG: hypothetical protein WD468_07745 [Pirellulales bacterium]